MSNYSTSTSTSTTRAAADDEFLTDREICQWLKVGYTTVRRLRYEKILPTVRVGRAVRVPRSAVDAYLASVTEAAR